MSLVLPPVRSSAALQQMYYDRLKRMVESMQRSIVWWLSVAYRANPPEMAQDAIPASVLKRVMARLTRHWTQKFNEAAPEMANYFTTKIAKRNKAVMAKALKKGGVTVKRTITPLMRDVFSATVNEQVSLIKSIAQEHLQQVEGLVMRSVSQGGDLLELSKQLRERYGVTTRRAALIARDQTNKATATLNRASQEDLGITQAIWKHSHAGKEPRPSHVKADGTIYNIKDGLVLDGERVWPGTAINCRCYCRSILPT